MAGSDKPEGDKPGDGGMAIVRRKRRRHAVENAVRRGQAAGPQDAAASAWGDHLQNRGDEPDLPPVRVARTGLPPPSEEDEPDEPGESAEIDDDDEPGGSLEIPVEPGGDFDDEPPETAQPARRVPWGWIAAVIVSGAVGLVTGMMIR